MHSVKRQLARIATIHALAALAGYGAIMLSVPPYLAGVAALWGAVFGAPAAFKVTRL